jgi:hypothetical protein
VEPCFTDSQPRLGLGPDQNRPDRAAVTHRHLVCLASALLTHRRMMRPEAQGQRTDDQAAQGSTAAAQEQRRCLMWDDIIVSLKEKHHGEFMLTALERLRVA